MQRYELNIRDYLRIIRKRRLVIIFTVFAVTIGTFFYTSKQPTIFASSTTIRIVNRQTMGGLLTDWIVYSPADEMESETKIINSYQILSAVAGKLGMIPKDATLNQISDIVNGLQGQVSTERVGQTNMIKITVTSGTAEGAMELARAVADIYVTQNMAEKAKQARHSRQFIEDQLAALEQRVQKAEERLKQYGDQVKSIRLAAPMEQKLTDLQFELAELTQRYTEKHPRVIQAREQIKEIESQIKGFSGIDIEYSRVTRELEVNKKLYGMLKEKLEEARITEAQNVADVTIVDPAFLPESPLTNSRRMVMLIGVLMGSVLGVSLAFVFETLDTSISTIEDVESMVKLRVLGAVPPIVIGDMQKKHGPFESIKELFYPTPPKKSDKIEREVYLVAHYEPRSPSAEAYRNIQTNLRLTPAKKTILVTSSGPREGKSTVVSNLGIVMAQAGLKTVLVTADLRRPSIGEAFGIKKEPGLSELITKAVGLKDVLRNYIDFMLGDMGFEDVRSSPGLENLWLITGGRLPFNPSEILKSVEINNLIQDLKNKFDVVVFDSPPVLPVTDASLLAPKVDSVVLVYEIGRTSREALIRSKTQLESVGAKLSGVILNHTKPETEAMSVYHSYRYQYGVTHDKGKTKKRSRQPVEAGDAT